MSVLKNTKVYMDGFDLSGDLNASNFDYGAEMLDGTHFGDEARVNEPGLATARLQHEGHWRAGGSGPDDAIFSRIGTPNVVTTLCPESGAVGEVAYTFRAMHPEYSLGGQVGELTPFSVSAEGDEGIAPVRGTVLNAAGSVTASGNGTGVEIAGGASYAALHVLSASASDTLDVTVESDINGSFPSPVTVATFSQMSDTGSGWQAISGAGADTWFRVSYTLGGTDPDFSFVVVVG